MRGCGGGARSSTAGAGMTPQPGKPSPLIATDTGAGHGIGSADGCWAAAIVYTGGRLSTPEPDRRHEIEFSAQDCSMGIMHRLIAPASAVHVGGAREEEMDPSLPVEASRAVPEHRLTREHGFVSTIEKEGEPEKTVGGS